MSRNSVMIRVVVATLSLPAIVSTVHAAPGEVLSHQKISDTDGNFVGPLDDGDAFGRGIASLGDLDGNGVADLAVGAAAIGGASGGAIWVLFLDADGTVKSHQKISDTEGNFTGTLDTWDLFGLSIALLGDLDSDGVSDVAVGAAFDDDGCTIPADCERGAVWVLFLNADGTVKSHQKISDTEGNFTGTLDDYDFFGISVASLGDLDDDGVADLAVGAAADDGAGLASRGAVWVLFLNADGTVKSHQKISDTEGDFTGTLEDHDSFGISVAPLGDLDGDGVEDLAVGAHGDDDGGRAYGAVWVLFLNTDGTVESHQKISATEGNFTGTLNSVDGFGFSVAWLGDLDGDGVGDLVAGAWSDNDGGPNRGAVWVLYLNADGTVKSHQKISDNEGNFTGVLNDVDLFGCAVAWMGDLDSDGVGELAVGAQADDDGGIDRGAVWALFLDGVPQCPSDCGDNDGTVGIADFLALLVMWGQVGVPCDIDGGGVGITDFLALLANWGPCP